jgi:hypothetical protein
MKLTGKTFAIGGAAVAILGVGYYLVLPDAMAAVKVYPLDGKITWVDYDTREASLEFKHPRTGTLREMTKEIPEDCEILIDGQAASFADLRVGDEVLVQGKWNRRTKEIHILSVTLVERPLAAPEPSEPSESSAPAPEAAAVE